MDSLSSAGGAGIKGEEEINCAEHLDDHQPSTINHQPNSECVPQGNPPAYARPGKASQDNARSQEKFIRKPFLQAFALFPISFLSALSYSAVKHPLRVWALISNPVKKSPRLNKEIRSLGIQGVKKLNKLIQLI